MLRSLINTKAFNNVVKDINSPSHAYLFYGEDEVLNIEFAKVFIASIFCGKLACGACEACRRVEINKNPDLLIIDKPSLQVADIEGLIDNVQLKPMIYNYKIVFITNADGINEIAQNKILKTLEEPNPKVIFVFACTNVEKLLPTIKSRMTKHYIPKIELGLVAEELQNKGIDISKFLHCDVTLTNAIKYTSSADGEILNIVGWLFNDLKSTSNIPSIVGNLKIKPDKRKEFLKLMLDAVNCAITSQQGLFEERVIEYLQAEFKIPVLIKMLKLIDLAIRKLDSNVNFNYVMDELCYNILKEKYLCK